MFDLCSAGQVLYNRFNRIVLSHEVDVTVIVGSEAENLKITPNSPTKTGYKK